MDKNRVDGLASQVKGAVKETATANTANTHAKRKKRIDFSCRRLSTRKGIPEKTLAGAKRLERIS